MNTDNKADNYIASEKQRLEESRKMEKGLFVRNILNVIFILLAIAAMVGVLIFKGGSNALTISYGLGIIAILVKMVEVMMRMPSMMRKTAYEQRKQNK